MYLFAVEGLKTFPLKVAEFVSQQDNLFRISPENLQTHAAVSHNHQGQAPNKSILSSSQEVPLQSSANNLDKCGPLQASPNILNIST